MKDWPRPKTLKILCGFLGLMGYYRKFVQNYGKLTAPLAGLLKKHSFTWTLAIDQYFLTLKEAMCMTHVLALPYFTNTFFMECDASEKGIGEVLMQDGRPLAFTSKQLSQTHLVQSIYENEMLSILHDVDLWGPYLLGKCFQIKIDHHILKSTNFIPKETKMGDQSIWK
jgi:hypothetical protein